jgi:hypothetical protein
VKIKVYKAPYGDWVAENNFFIVWCSTWEDAMESAWGHVAMRHS